ncbi:M48 family peptidase [Actinomadura craniellae]|uniref:M48 family peptidase n=1 Tax=Actinomadura craniellae TaxID=2231787 RepID=A0A365H268_9ACTN|nr:M48 family metallopeptidase [Actinomadura craniellae]RAY13128.1 M48 family peptidase [Actinomadura craniellae]
MTSPSGPPGAPPSEPVPQGRPRTAAAITAVALFAGLALVLGLTTPWSPLPGEPPGGPVPVDPALDFSSAEIARSQAFDAAITPPAYAGLLTGLVVVLALGLTPLGARLIDLVTRPVGRRRATVLRVGLAAMVLTAVLRLAGLPFDLWAETVLRRHGLSVQTWPAWAADQFRSLVLTWVIWVLALALLYPLVRRFPRYWWTGAAAGGFALVVTVSFAYPVVVEPVFNSFTSMPAGQLRTDLLKLAERDGVPVQDVLVADASRRTTALNAYVSGFGSTRRIVVYDTLLESSPPARVESIVAHELGHAERQDVLYGTLTGALGVAGAVCLLYLLLTSPRLLRRSAAGSPGDPRSVALLIALVSVLTQLGGPAQTLVSRRIEARADVHALELTRDPATFAAMQRELSVRNLSDLAPGRLEYLLWSTHPSGPERLALARTWARLRGVPEPDPLYRR